MSNVRSKGRRMFQINRQWRCGRAEYGMGTLITVQEFWKGETKALLSLPLHSLRRPLPPLEQMSGKSRNTDTDSQIKQGTGPRQTRPRTLVAELVGCSVPTVTVWVLGHL